MSNLVVIIFENEEDALAVRDAIRKQQHEGLISLDDSAVITKDPDGKVHIKNEMDRGVKVGAVGGSLLGLLIAGIFFPIGGLIIGGLLGAGVGKLADIGIEKKFVKEVAEKIQPGNSAIFLLVKQANAAAAVAALRPYKGEVYHTTLTSEDEETLRRALKDRQ
ncbi:MAG: DUF1269 domain-containing protein [Caldilineales bacterium]|nr:DUF1269 domain-containing protein [Caldilineales bacterium]